MPYSDVHYESTRRPAMTPTELTSDEHIWSINFRTDTGATEQLSIRLLIYEKTGQPFLSIGRSWDQDLPTPDDHYPVGHVYIRGQESIHQVLALLARVAVECPGFTCKR